MRVESSITHLTALLYPKLHFIEYHGTYTIPVVPSSPGTQPPFNAKEDFLSHWLYLAVHHREPTSPHSLVPDVLTFYNYHLQKAFFDIHYELESFCKIEKKQTLFRKLLSIITDAPVVLQERFEADLLFTISEVETLALENYQYDSYETARADIEIKPNTFATTFFSPS